MSRRIGPRMREVAEYVARHPGCSGRAAALSLSYHGHESNQYGYAAVLRTLRAGIISDRGTRARYALYVSDPGAGA